jgi:hypothetical protein
MVPVHMPGTLLVSSTVADIDLLYFKPRGLVKDLLRL